MAVLSAETEFMNKALHLYLNLDEIIAQHVQVLLWLCESHQEIMHMIKSI